MDTFEVCSLFPSVIISQTLRYISDYREISWFYLIKLMMGHLLNDVWNKTVSRRKTYNFQLSSWRNCNNKLEFFVFGIDTHIHKCRPYNLNHSIQHKMGSLVFNLLVHEFSSFLFNSERFEKKLKLWK